MSQGDIRNCMHCLRYDGGSYDAVYKCSTMIDVNDAIMQVLLQRLCEDEYGAKVVGNHSKGRWFQELDWLRPSNEARVVRRQTMCKTAPGAWYSLLSERGKA